MAFVRGALACAALCSAAGLAHAQTTAFTYQGRLQDGAIPASGSHDFELRLFLEPVGGTALATIQRAGVAVTNGLFTVTLDFGPQFSGAARHLCVTDAQIAAVSGSKATGLVPVAAIPPGSGNCVQNATSPQAALRVVVCGDHPDAAVCGDGGRQ